MDPKKRSWLYGGLALPPGVAHVSRPGEKLIRPGTRLLLAGDGLALGLAAPLNQLAKEHDVTFAIDAKPGTRFADWTGQPWLAVHKELVRPTVVLLAMGMGDVTTRGALGPSAAVSGWLRGAHVVWLVPPAPMSGSKTLPLALAKSGATVLPAHTLAIHRGPDGIEPSALGYAGWAGATWAWLTR